MLLAAHLLVITENFTKIQNSKRLAAFVGIVPYQHQSGTSVSKRAKIRHFGPGPSRKLLRGWLLNRWPLIMQPLDAIIYVN
jgi:hypothetical protein